MARLTTLICIGQPLFVLLGNPVIPLIYSHMTPWLLHSRLWTCYHKHLRVRFSAHIKQPLAENQKRTPLWERKANSGNAINDVYASLLQASTNINVLEQVHGHMLRNGFDQNIFLGAKLVNMYAMCGSLENARLVFDKMHNPNAFLWNTMIRGYARNGYCELALTSYCQMHRTGVQPDNFSFPFVLKACATLSALQEGKEVHCHVVKTGFESDVFVDGALMDLYVKCGKIEDARQVFDKMSHRDVVSWTVMIAGYAQNGHPDDALTLFYRMQMGGLIPDAVTVMTVLAACVQVGSLQQGKWIHSYIIRSGFELDVSVMNSLIDMYAKCGSIEMARQLFDKFSKRDVISWSSMIAGYARNGHSNEALTLFNQMQLAGVEPNSVTMVSVLPAYAHLGSLQQGKRMHGYIIRSGFQSIVSVGTVIIDKYVKCGSVEDARQVFDHMSRRDVVSWSAMIAGYAQNGRAKEALTLFNQMQLENIIPDLITMVSMLQACAHLGALQQGKWIHEYIIRSGFEEDVFMGTALIDMYAKCGCIEIARQLFDKLYKRDVVSWSAMIAGYGMHGRGGDALALFSRMQEAGMKPNHITFVSVLSACSHAGLVDEGWQYFDSMSQDYQITPGVEHYACMVDLLGRAGHLNGAQDFIKKMPLEPDSNVWGALLGACRIHCNIELGEQVAEQLFHLDPENVGYYVLLSNIYAAAGRWDDVAKMRTMMKSKGLKQTPGCSFVEIKNRVHAFVVGDRSHPQSDKIYATLETLSGQMEEAGYVPNRNFVLHDVEEEIKECILYSHSEKLAISFGIISTSPGTPIRITKNLRVCGDCHSATKFISKIVKREIIMRDTNRFHHFKDGLCSCGDHW